MQLIEESEVEFDDDAWGEISEEAKDLLMQIFQPETKRLSAKKVLGHPWITKYSVADHKGAVLDSQIHRLKSFQNKSKFRKTILSYLSTRVNDSDVEKEK